jgi:hypothetical protein
VVVRVLLESQIVGKIFRHLDFSAVERGPNFFNLTKVVLANGTEHALVVLVVDPLAHAAYVEHMVAVQYSHSLVVVEWLDANRAVSLRVQYVLRRETLLQDDVSSLVVSIVVRNRAYKSA